MRKSARRTPPRWVRWTLAGVVALVASVWFGVTTASADLSLGPHEARYEVTVSGDVVVDLGPLGTMRVPSPVRPLGVDVIIREIPADLTEIDQATTLEGLSQDLQSYLQFFSTPEATIREVTNALLVDAARRTVVALVAVGVVGAGLWFLVGAVRRAELVRRVGPRTGEITAGVLVLALVGGMLAADDRGTRPNAPVSPVFAGTGLEGARLTGRLAGLIDTYGAQLLEIYRSNERFYADAQASLNEAWDAQAVTDARLAAAESRVHTATPENPSPATPGTESPGTESPGTESPGTESPGTESSSPEPSDAETSDAEPPDAGASDAESSDAPSGLPTLPELLAPSASAEPVTPEEDLVSFLVVSDLHCNMNMTPLIRDIAERAEVSAILDAGDTTMNGTAVEKVCVDSFATARPKGVPMIVSDGNHDSVLVADAQRSAGLTVLEGSVVDVAGVHILGDRDPNETRVGAGTSSRGESAPEVGRRLAATACEDDVDLLLIHTPSVGDASMWSGCVPFQVSGHTHTRYDPQVRGYGVRYVNGSTAGAASGQPTVGPLHGTAQMTVLRFDPNLRRFVDWKLVEVFPDATASVSGWQPIPVPPEKPAADDAEGDDGTQSSGTQSPGTQADESQADESQADERQADESQPAETPDQ